MSQALPDYQPDMAHLITEEDEPVELKAGKQQRLLTESLSSSWRGLEVSGRSHIGVFYLAKIRPSCLTCC
jgi:hypothetical protein